MNHLLGQRGIFCLTLLSVKWYKSEVQPSGSGVEWTRPSFVQVLFVFVLFFMSVSIVFFQVLSSQMLRSPVLSIQPS